MLSLLDNKMWIYFVKYPLAKAHVRKLARLTNVSPTTVITLINPLIKQNLLKQEKEGKNHVLSVNYNNSNFTFFKKWTNLFLFLNSGLIDEIKDKTDNIILFGSYAKGEDVEKSDIDLAIMNNINIIDLIKYEDILNRKIQFHIIEKKTNNYLMDNIRQGIIIKGVMS